MGFPQTIEELKAAGYKFDGESQCKSCGADIEWWTTPRGKKMPVDHGKGNYIHNSLNHYEDLLKAVLASNSFLVSDRLRSSASTATWRHSCSLERVMLKPLRFNSYRGLSRFHTSINLVAMFTAASLSSAYAVSVAWIWDGNSG